MPSPGTPLVDLDPQLLRLLLRSLLWLALSGLVVGGSAWALARRRNDLIVRVRALLLGATGEPTEFRARKFLRVSLGLLWVLDGLLQAQPDMPAGFIREMISPGIASSPWWLAGIVNPLAGAWTRHPVVADATTVWIQVGLGVLILVGGRGLLSKAVLWASVAWSLVVWITGEFLGGLLTPGASWLVGAPGAVLVYAIASLFLLAPWSWWETGRCATLARRSVAVWMLIGAGLQALPWEGSWTASDLSAPFSDGAGTAQPALLRQPIVWLTTLTQAHPATTNALLIAALLVVALGLWWSHRAEFVIAGIVICAATWWLAQDFGVLGGLGTDPNTALPLALLLACSFPQWAAKATEPFGWKAHAAARRAPALREPVAAGAAALGLGAALVAPLMVIGALVGPADSAAVAADSGGGVLSIPHRASPGFALTDQDNRSVTSRGLHGKLTLLTFLDPVCSDDCPVIANQLAEADRELGSLANRIEIVAIDSNPLFHHVSDVAAFTTSHGLQGLPNWHFLTGPVATLQDLAASYGIAVQVPAVGMIEHGDGIYFLAPNGMEEAYLGDGADSSLTTSYARSVSDEVRRLLA